MQKSFISKNINHFKVQQDVILNCLMSDVPNYNAYFKLRHLFITKPVTTCSVGNWMGSIQRTF